MKFYINIRTEYIHMYEKYIGKEIPFKFKDFKDKKCILDEIKELDEISILVFQIWDEEIIRELSNSEQYSTCIPKGVEGNNEKL